MILKQGVSIDGCRPEILIAAIKVIAPIFDGYGKEAVITSGTEKHKHSARRSRHYAGDALDFRHRFFDTIHEKVTVMEELQEALGKHFVVVLESTHYHVHFAPVYEE